MANIKKAKLIKMKTDDGLMNFLDTKTSVGIIYSIDMDTLREVTLMNFEYGIKHKKQVVQDAAFPDDRNAFLPLECLEILDGE